MKKVLMLASVASMIKQFNMENIEILLAMGYQVDVACNFKEGSTCDEKSVAELKKKLEERGVRCFQIDFSRKMKELPRHLKAYRQVKSLLEQESYNFIHCHSPIGGAIGRLTAHRTGTRTMYTAHGFHFYKGGPIKNWLLYYPIERYLARYTDVLIVINREDWRTAKKFGVKKLCYVPGVGIDTGRFQHTASDKQIIRRKEGIPENAFVLLSVGELNKNKNHSVIVKALKMLHNPDIFYCIAGQGEMEKKLEKLIKKSGLGRQIRLLGYRENIIEIYRMADVFCFPSQREGLGLAALEAMASGLPLIVSDIHGIRDYAVNGETGYNVKVGDVSGFARAISALYRKREMCAELFRNNKTRAWNFDCGRVNKVMKKIYSQMQDYDKEL